MKQILIKISLTFLCIIGISNITGTNVYAYNIKETKHLSSEENKEKLYEDFLTILLAPHLDDAIESYYGKSKKYNDVKVVDIKRVEKESYYFDVTFQVKTFEDSSKPIGIETITIRNDDGEIDVVNFIHQDVPVKTSK